MVQCQALPIAVQKKILAMILSKLICVVLNPYIIVFKSLIDWCAIIDIDRCLYISMLFLFETTNMLVCGLLKQTKPHWVHKESVTDWIFEPAKKPKKSSTGDQRKKQVHWYSKQWGFPIQADTPLNTNIGTNMELNKKEILEDEVFV